MDYRLVAFGLSFVGGCFVSATISGTRELILAVLGGILAVAAGAVQATGRERARAKEES